MKRLFSKWLLLLVILAFGLTFGLSWFLHKKEAKKNALQLLSLNLTDTANRLKRAENNLETITEMSKASAIAKTRAFALLIKENPAILKDFNELKKIKQKLDVDELHVSDKTGKLIASVNKNKNNEDSSSYVNFNLSSTEQSKVFMESVTNPNFELVQSPQRNGAEKKLFQYTGVARLDAPGVVQIGYHPTRIKKAQQLANIKNIESDTRIGINGKLSIEENTVHPFNYQKTFYTKEGICKSIVYGKYLLTAMLPWNEVYSKNRTVIIALFIGNVVVFGLVFLLVINLLQKVVIKEISEVTNSLDEISKGNFNQTIEVKSSSELSALADSVNKTVQALKNNQVSNRVESDNEITSMLKNSLLPANIPQNSNYKFMAKIFNNEDICENLCDFVKLDNERIALLFINAPKKSIAAGLHMIKVKNMLRKSLLKNSPEKALEIVNEELFNQKENHMSLKVFLGVLNCHSGVMLTFNAGHENPIIKSANGSAKFIKGPFIPLLGSSLEASFTKLALQLDINDRICFYSNSTIENTNSNGEKYGTSRLLEVISASNDKGDELIDTIYKNINNFTNNSNKTDVEVAIFTYTPNK
jgi:serine phosphatase RsbU (regulator of sigma subunit)